MYPCFTLVPFVSFEFQEDPAAFWLEPKTVEEVRKLLKSRGRSSTCGNLLPPLASLTFLGAKHYRLRHRSRDEMLSGRRPESLAARFRRRSGQSHQSICVSMGEERYVLYLVGPHESGKTFSVEISPTTCGDRRWAAPKIYQDTNR